VCASVCHETSFWIELTDTLPISSWHYRCF
jgi:hypothetical protein